MPRKYSMERRTGAVDETRQRIVEATVALHMEKGVQATSMQDIAARASVSLGTVYRHFPTVDELLPACGSHTFELNPPPSESAFDSLAGIDRPAALISALYKHFQATERAYVVGYAEAPQFPVLRDFMNAIDTNMRLLAAEAVAPLDLSAEETNIFVALIDFNTWYAFRRAGFTTAESIRVVCEIATERLTHDPGKRMV